MKIRFLGTRGSLPSPGPDTVKFGGNTTCIEVVSDENVTVIVDSGTGIRKMNTDFKPDSQNTIKIIFTHAHWDHLQGLPFFNQLYVPQRRFQMLINSKFFEEIKNDIIKQMTGETFPVKFKDLPSKIEFIPMTDVYEFNNSFKVELFENNHPGGSTGLKFTNNKKVFTFITDNELGLMKKNNNGLSDSYESFVKFCLNSNILVHEAQYIDSDMITKKGWGHSTIREVLNLFCDAKPELGIFTHYDPERSDTEIKKQEKWINKEKKLSMCKVKIKPAYENMIINI